RALPEVLQRAGWWTIAALPSPRHARGLGGFSRGFDVFEAPQVGAPERAASDVVASILPALGASLEGPGRVFALLAFSDGFTRSAPLDHPAAREIVERWMAPLAAENSRVAAALEELRSGEGGGLDEFVQLFARARSGRLASAWESALAELRIASIDTAVAEVLDALERTGRASRTAVLLGGLRGRADRDATAGPGLAPPSIEVPLWTRMPEAESGFLFEPGADRPDRHPPSVVDYAMACSEHLLDGWPAQEPFPAAGARFPGARTAALTAALDGSLHAARELDLHVERYADGELVAFRDGAVVELDEARRQVIAPLLAGFSAPPAIEVSAVPDGLDLRWHLADGARVPREGARRAPAARGGLADMDEAPGGARRLPLARRSTGIRVAVRGSDVAPTALALGARRASDLPVLYLPSENAPAFVETEGGPGPRLGITRASGLDWNLTLSGEGLPEGARAEVLLTVWPPRDPSDLLEVPASNVQVTHVAGRRDLVHLAGALPFDVLVKKTGRERFAVSCAIDGAFLAPYELVADGGRYAGPGGFDLLLPSWQPGVSGVMTDLTEALFDQDGRAPEGTLGLRRSGFGPIPRASSALEFDALEFVRTLPPGE
ncbi:MAG: hypothetical protein VX460_04905, partial [Planctomycetota bacterium]|nr:hypothetical protein [Planctomycetota bacterium]